MNLPFDIVTLSWIAFILFWIISAFSAKRNLRYGSYGIGVRLAVVAAFVLLFQWAPARESLLHAQGALVPAVQWIGAILAICGVSTAIWARIYLGRNWGMPMSLKENPELVTGGTYTYIRNPIYTGMILTTLGTTLVVIWWAVVFVSFLVYFIYASKKEEKIMLKEFPDQYPAYKKRTKMLIPFVL